MGAQRVVSAPGGDGVKADGDEDEDEIIEGKDSQGPAAVEVQEISRPSF
jgi:hypothetical protein